MSVCRLLGHHMEPALGQWDKDYADLFCTRCGHGEPGVTLIRPGEPTPEIDPLVLKGERVSFVTGWAILLAVFPAAPLLIGLLLSWVGAGIWTAAVLWLVCLLFGDGGGGAEAGGGHGGPGATGAMFMAQGPLR